MKNTSYETTGLILFIISIRFTNRLTRVEAGEKPEGGPLNINSWAMGLMLLIASGLAWRESQQPSDTTVHAVVVRVPPGARVVRATVRFERHSKDVALQGTTNGDGLVPSQQTPGRVRSVEITYPHSPNGCDTRPTVMIDGQTASLWHEADRMADRTEDGADVVRCRFIIITVNL